MGLYYDGTVLGIRYKQKPLTNSSWPIIETFMPESHGTHFVQLADALVHTLPDGRYGKEYLRSGYTSTGRMFLEWICETLFCIQNGSQTILEME